MCVRPRQLVDTRDCKRDLRSRMAQVSIRWTGNDAMGHRCRYLVTAGTIGVCMVVVGCDEAKLL